MKNEFFADDFVFNCYCFIRKVSTLFSSSIFISVAAHVVNKKYMLGDESPMLITYYNTIPLLSTIVGPWAPTKYAYNP